MLIQNSQTQPSNGKSASSSAAIPILSLKAKKPSGLGFRVYGLFLKLWALLGNGLLLKWDRNFGNYLSEISSKLLESPLIIPYI